MSNIVKKENLTLDSREVAEMVGKQHKNLLADIRKYEEFLTSSKVSSLDFFMENTYQDTKGEERPNYQVTKKGCEFIAHKLTGQKGAIFTATYINRFHDMEQALKQPTKQVTSPEDKLKLADARVRNAKARQANVLLKIANQAGLNKTYKQVLFSYASAIIADKPLIPLPELEEETLTAEEVGNQLGITANMVGRIAKANNLKIERYGKWFHDKSRYSNKEVPSFRYYQNVIPVIRQILKEVN